MKALIPREVTFHALQLQHVTLERLKLHTEEVADQRLHMYLHLEESHRDSLGHNLRQHMLRNFDCR